MSTFIQGHVYTLKDEFVESFPFNEYLDRNGVCEGSRFTIKATTVDEYGDMYHDGNLIAQRDMRHMFKDKGNQYSFEPGKTYQLKRKYQHEYIDLAEMMGIEVDTTEELRFVVDDVTEFSMQGTCTLMGEEQPISLNITERHMYFEVHA